ncbi:DNA alkylation repair protein [Candidatus Gracilibacteria bacterium]|nr:DNA alkylation repair protein [Candidatus Gracilibacteria bacterium]
MWRQQQREFQYFGQDILDLFVKEYKKDDWLFLEKLILEKPWWDTVDFLSSHQFRDYSLLFPEKSKWVVDRWLSSEEIWLQRSCLLYQLWHKENTDLVVLEKCIDKLKNSDEFFIQKSIGWILREYSKTDQQWVEKYIKNTSLKPLSVREASKYLKK